MAQGQTVTIVTVPGKVLNRYDHQLLCSQEMQFVLNVVNCLKSSFKGKWICFKFCDCMLYDGVSNTACSCRAPRSGPKSQKSLPLPAPMLDLGTEELGRGKAARTASPNPLLLGCSMGAAPS